MRGMIAIGLMMLAWPAQAQYGGLTDTRRDVWVQQQFNYQQQQRQPLNLNPSHSSQPMTRPFESVVPPPSSFNSGRPTWSSPYDTAPGQRDRFR